jgi:hypothetical protein
MNYVLLFSLFTAFILPLTLLTSHLSFLHGCMEKKKKKDADLHETLAVQQQGAD